MASSNTRAIGRSPLEAPAVDPLLKRFVDQWAVLLTTHRPDGTTVPTPVNIAVEGDHAFVRTYDQARKVSRMRKEPTIEIAPCTWRGRPTGPPLRCSSRLLGGAPSEHAGRLIDLKYPVFQRILVRSGHRFRRYRTLHFELRPLKDGRLKAAVPAS